MKRNRFRLALVLLTTLALLAPGGVMPQAWADPCGMVPPLYLTGSVVRRAGPQQTYVFFADGVETIALRPGFTGNASEFGMLIPFPSPPAVRKAPDDIFDQLAAAVDPPPVYVTVWLEGMYWSYDAQGRWEGNMVEDAPAEEGGMSLRRDEVQVLNEEAVGMYEVAVLAAGSAEALARWMEGHEYRFPEGMEDVCDEYIAQGWCFVAVKTSLAARETIEPQPGQHEVTPGLPADASYDGFVQAMAFRFTTDEPVVPMRLSVFNEGETHNVVYVLTDGPRRIRGIPAGFVKRQVSGEELIANLTQPLPLIFRYGDEDDLTAEHLNALAAPRNPTSLNGAARDIFTSDLVAANTGELTLAHEASEKELLRISLRLSLTGPEVDQLHHTAIEEERVRLTAAALSDLEGMTLTVVDGVFPPRVLARQNLTFSAYRMPADRNVPRPPVEGLPGEGFVPTFGSLERTDSATLAATLPERPAEPADATSSARGPSIPLASLLLVGAAGLCLLPRKPAGRWTALILLALAIAQPSTTIGQPGPSEQPPAAQPPASAAVPQVVKAIEELGDPATSESAAQRLIERGAEVVEPLYAAALAAAQPAADNTPSYAAATDVMRGGWAIVCLSEIEEPAAKDRLARLRENESLPPLVRTWAVAGIVSRAESLEELLALPEIGRPEFQSALRRRVFALAAASDDELSLSDLMALSQQQSSLASALAPVILARPSAELVELMLTSPQNEYRWLAAGYLAALGTLPPEPTQEELQTHEELAAAVLAGYHFDREAQAVPWQGGALYVPAASWNRDEAREILGLLLRWRVWCIERELYGESQQTVQNMSSVSLQNQAELQLPWEALVADDAQIEQLLLSWGNNVGRDSLAAILADAAPGGRYDHLLDKLDVAPSEEP